MTATMAHVGPGVAGRLRETLTGYGARRVLLVHGRGSYRRSGAAALVADSVGTALVVHVPAVTPNPDVAQIAAGVAVARWFRPEVVVGIGGGSSLDVAKCIAVLAPQPAPVEACLLDPRLVTVRRTARLVLVPTTAGSGSELTRFATVYREHRKLSLDLDQVRADVALVDPDLTRALPVRESASAGLDALAHAVESIWSVSSTRASRATAWNALRLLVPALADAAGRGSFGTDRIRRALAHGAALAGAAIDVTRTTAAHALSYDLTSRLDVPHGAAVALHLKWLVRRHSTLVDADCRHPDGAAAVRRRVDRIEGLVRECGAGTTAALIERLLRLGGHPADLRQLGLPVRPWSARWTDALVSTRAANNPGVLGRRDLDALL